MTGEANYNKSFKCLILLLWIIDTVDAGFTNHIAYFYCISNYLNPTSIMTPIPHESVHRTFWLHALFTNICTTIIRSLFMFQIYHLSKHSIIATLWITAGNITAFVCVILHRSKTNFLSKLYLNSYLAALNAKKNLRGRINKGTAVQLSNLSSGHSNSQPGLETFRTAEVHNSNFIEISVETNVDDGKGNTVHFGDDE
ncbi:hypothetical protein K435DRAFT_799178 [Dendrothele bispora CBS 962.96]|uniref:Uncharacterized protein n=1 Tax=Dendrothele bispora (strain CBS 962.96) TaxID=1314807 RepID=A0A4S8LWS1_DENBC|nr:hypothetical protein K435DRAFT_799178 [Dendrothele bispora CBS 962.96]